MCWKEIMICASVRTSFVLFAMLPWIVPQFFFLISEWNYLYDKWLIIAGVQWFVIIMSVYLFFSFDVMQRYQFKSIRVDFPEQILINEKAPGPHHVARASIHAHNKPWFFLSSSLRMLVLIPICCIGHVGVLGGGLFRALRGGKQ